MSGPLVLTRLRLAEVVGALSLATDLGMGQPLEHGLRTCLFAIELARRSGADDATVARSYYVALLRWLGCTSHAHELARWFDDEVAAHNRSAAFDWDDRREVLSDLVRNAGAGRSPVARLVTVVGAIAAGPDAIGELFQSSCEVARTLASRLALGPGIERAVQETFERWDGRGWPAALAGEAISLSARIVQVAGDAVVVRRLGGDEAVREVLRDRAGSVYDPSLVTSVLADLRGLAAATEVESAWDVVLEAEPAPHLVVPPEGIGRTLAVAADFADLKSPYTSGHSSGVARLAATAARDAGLPGPDATTLEWAGYVHDLGRVGIPNGVWERPGRLDAAGRERVRLHPYYTERILARSSVLAPVGGLAALHHERLDGSGYHRGAPAALQPPAARFLAAADVLHALLEPRVHRPAYQPAAAVEVLRSEARAGRLDPEAVEAVLVAAGHQPRRRRSWPAGLTTREVEIVRLVARGATSRAIAAELHISARTVAHHIEHIYDKIGTRTRASATLFAIANGLLEPEMGNSADGPTGRVP
ncbi:MAG TPA: HD domain-containing phosphohydrolase [Nitriliruptorales bacterium]|nr:HD domain-containing phosphohydrolase [Nitriliruptorales bacterium]